MYISTLSLTSTLDGVCGKRHPPATLPPGKTSTHCTGGWVAPGPVWNGAENLDPTEIRSPDGPARSGLLYRLSYPGSLIFIT
jgi:hypothetical protein